MRYLIGFAAACVGGGCGPAVPPAQGGTTTGETATDVSTSGVWETTGSSPPTATGVDPQPGTTVTTSPPGTTGVDPGDETGWQTSTGGSSGDPDACGCPPVTEVAFEQIVDGWSAEQALEDFPPLTLPFYWHGLADTEPTTMTVSVAYAGGSVELGPGGDDGCNFLSGPCQSGFRIEVEVEMLSADGLLVGTFDGIVWAPDPDDGLSFVEGADVSLGQDQVNPSFLELPFQFEGMPVPPGELYARVDWGTANRFDEPSIQLQSFQRADAYLLGASFPPR